MDNRRTLVEALREVWMSGLGARAEGEGGVATRLAELLGQRREEAQRLADELGQWMRQQRSHLEQQIGESLARVTEPKRKALLDKVEQLRGRTERLAERIETQRHTGRRASRRA